MRLEFRCRIHASRNPCFQFTTSNSRFFFRQTLVDFFENDNSGMADIAVFNAMFRFLFMEPPKKKSNQARNRITIMAKLISLAMGIQSKILLNCTGNWLQLDGPTSERSMELVNILVTDYILLLPSQEIAWENLKQLPEISPVFVENFICAVSELYYTGESVFRPPPANVLELVTAWVSKHPLVLVAGSMNRQQSGLASPASVQVRRTLKLSNETNKTGDINNLLGQTHSSDHFFFT